MVVVQSVPSTSKPPRKNRRTLSKKKPPRVAGDNVDQDHGMNNVPLGSDKPAGRSPDEEILIDVDGPDVAPPIEAPSFGPAPASAGQTLKSEARRVAIPPHRMSPLKKDWINIFGPLTEILGLQIRMNVQRKCVEMRVRPSDCHYRDLVPIYAHRRQNTQRSLARSKRELISSRHMLLGSMLTWVMVPYDISTSIDSPAGCHSSSPIRRSLSRLVRDQGCKDPSWGSPFQGHWYVPSMILWVPVWLRQGFQGRIAGQDGKTKFTIENASRTRIILADTWVDVFFRPRHAN